MRKYLIFAGSTYYPEGGWSDFITSTDVLDYADSWIKHNGKDYDWYQVVDRDKEEIVRQKG